MLAPPLLLAMLLAGQLPSIAGQSLRVASFNVQALSARDSEARFNLVAAEVAKAGFPEVLALQEIADDDGTVDSTQVSAGQTLQRLSQALSRAGGPAYRALEVAPRDDAEGGPPGANIRNVVFTTLPFVASGQADPNAVPLPSSNARLSPNPGRLAQEDPAYAQTRRPLVVEVGWQGRPLVLINVHLSSGADRRSKRWAQAAALTEFVRRLQTRPSARIILLGDFNASSDEQVYQELRNVRLFDLHESGAGTHKSGAALDHIFVSEAIKRRRSGVLPYSAASDHALVWADVEAAGDGMEAEGGCQMSKGARSGSASKSLWCTFVLAFVWFRTGRNRKRRAPIWPPLGVHAKYAPGYISRAQPCSLRRVG